MKNIPKIIYFYWGKNKPLSYMKYLSVLSFSKLNPDWKICVYYPNHISYKDDWEGNEQKWLKNTNEDYFDKLNEINNLQMIPFQTDINLSEVHKSDLLRLDLLYRYGGVWSDFDIFYLKPLSELKVKDGDTYICYHYDYHSIGFLMSKKDNNFYGSLLNYIIKALQNTNELQYQSIGAWAYTNFFKYTPKRVEEFNKKYNVDIKNIPFTCFYPFDWKQVDLIYGRNKQLFDNTIGIHWFAGSKKSIEYENIVTEKNIKSFNDILLLKLMGDFI